MPLRVITPATADAVTLALIKQNCRLEVEDATQDGLLKLLLSAATEEFEQQTSRQLCIATWELVLPGFVAEVFLEKTPLRSIASVKYFDTNNVEQTLDASLYDANKDAHPAQVLFKEMPATYERHDAVIIRFDAGYDNDKVPEDIQLAITVYVTQRYLTPGNHVDNLPTYFTRQVRNNRIWKQK